MVTLAQGPTALSTRPPTPPKAIEEAAKLPIGPTYQGTFGQHILLDTSDESPSSSSECVSDSAGKLPKRVIFSPWTSYHKAVYPSGKANVVDLTIRPLPPSRECIAMHKSILKVSAGKGSPLFDGSPKLMLDPSERVTVMFRQAAQHMVNGSRDSRLDTYSAVLRCLSTYDEVPDNASLADNLAAFLEYIRRDVSAKQPETGAPDTELITIALKVLSTILYTQDVVDAVADEFCTFIAERAVSSLECQDMPKTIVDHYMHLLARQKLPQKIINADRANRLLNALNGLEARLKGNRVVGLKLMIYQRLLVQSKSSMVPRAEEWLEFLVASVSSSIKEIRQRAIAFGTEAALTLGTTSTVSQACLDIFDGETPSGKKVVDALGDRMLQLLNIKDEGLHVPQIWSIIILFLRSRRRQIERWEHLKGWLGIMERSFNSSDLKVKLQANIAWNRLVFALDLDTSTSASMIKVLRQPIASQLERKGSDKNLRHAKRLARSSYCTLLYYSFRPGASHEQLDLYWDNFVTPVLSAKPSATASDYDFACEVLGAILSSSQPRIWDQNRANQLSPPMKASELPCLDPRWVRLRIAKVVGLLTTLYSHTNYVRPEDPQWASFLKTWQSLVRALGDASSKEIKVSIETMTAIAHIISMLNRQAPRRLEQYMALVNETVATVGFRPFTEKRLLRASSGIAFEAAETPSTRSSHPRGSLNSPIMYMLDALVNDGQDDWSQDTRRDAIDVLLTMALRATNSRRAQVLVLRELATDVLSMPSGGYHDKLTFWQCVARQTECALSLVQSKVQDSDSPQRPDHDYKEVVRVLDLGIRGFDTELYPSWKALSDTVIEKIREETCESGVLVSYTEPLSRVVHEAYRNCKPDTALRCGSYVLSCARWPQSREELERARKQLWGPGYIAPRPDPLDPLDHIYIMVEALLTSTYLGFQSVSQDVVTDLVASVCSFLSSCPQSQRAICLKNVQLGLAVWIEDAQALLTHSEGAHGAGSLCSCVRKHVLSNSNSD